MTTHHRIDHRVAHADRESGVLVDELVVWAEQLLLFVEVQEQIVNIVHSVLSRLSQRLGLAVNVIYRGEV